MNLTDLTVGAILPGALTHRLMRASRAHVDAVGDYTAAARLVDKAGGGLRAAERELADARQLVIDYLEGRVGVDHDEKSACVDTVGLRDVR